MEWPPPKHRRPRNFEFSAHRDGWAKWYKGQTRIITIKSIDRGAVRDAWDERRKRIDEQLARLNVGGVQTIRSAASLYYEWLDRRVATGLPDPMAPATAADYKRQINSFGRAIGPETRLRDIGPQQFKTFADTLAGSTPTTFARLVAYVQAFFQWCKDEGHVSDVPQYGRYFVKPKQQEHRDVRIGQAKSYTTAQLRLLWFHADFEEKVWMAWGLCGALDNSDIAHLTTDVLDRSAGTIDYRRRKRGKVRRVIPLPPIAWELLDLYRRPEPKSPDWSDRVFLTPTGLPLQRLVPSPRGIENPIDYVAMCWTRLMIRAGLKQPIPRLHRMVKPPRERRIKARGSPAGQGFRALRTTFANLAPAGYRDEIEVILGHAHGTVLLDSYLEEHGVERLRECVNHVWHRAFQS